MEYDITLGTNWIDSLGDKLLGLREISRDTPIMVFTSPNIGGWHYSTLEKSLKKKGFERLFRHDIPDGETNKNLDEYNKALQALAEIFGKEEKPLIINLGGGVVGDLGGFVAATYSRGIPYVQVPTTLLAFVDSAVGGKVGININGIKNMAGQFWQPKLVFGDFDFLKTLDAREVRSAIAEIIKYGAVLDKELFEYLEMEIDSLINLTQDTLEEVVSKCCRIKRDVVQKDERDNKGVRNVLNFGHTVGHAIEAEAHRAGKDITHGEAISIGMIAAANIAVTLGWINVSDKSRLSNLLARAKLPQSTSELGYNLSIEHVLKTMRRDKKFSAGQNLFILPKGIGNWDIKRGISKDMIVTEVKPLIS